MRNLWLLCAVFVLALVGCGGSNSSDEGTSRVEPAGVRSVAIPSREYFYSDFDSRVVRSYAEAEALAAQGRTYPGNRSAEFLQAIEDAQINWDTEALVLIRDTEGSGSIGVTFETPRREGSRVLSRIRRDIPEVGTTDIAYHAFALAVTKSQITEVVVEVEDKPTITVPVSQ